MDSWLYQASSASVCLIVLSSLGAGLALALRAGLDPLITLSIGPGLGIAVLVVIWYCSWILKTSVEAVVILAAALLVIGLIQLRFRGNPICVNRPSRDVLLALCLALASILWRAWLMRDLAFPTWVDSVQHGAIIRALLDQRAVPSALVTDPNVQFAYHWGFHAVSASMLMLLNMDVPGAILSVGHGLVAILVMNTYAACRKHGCRTSVAIFASLAALWATNVPDQLVWWGRYTMLCGMCVVFSLFVLMDSRTQERGTRFALVPLLTVGAVLSHYFTAVLILAWFSIRALSSCFARGPRNRIGRGFSRGASLIAVLLASFAALLPWMLRVTEVTSIIPGVARLDSAAGSSLDSAFFPGYASYWRGILGNAPSILCAGLAAAGIWSKGWRLWALWLAVLAFLSLPWSPYFVPFRPDYALMMLWIVVWPLAGGAAESILRVVGHGRPVLKSALVFSMSMLLAASASQQLSADRRVLTFAYPADLLAMSWIRENTPPSAIFHIQTAPWSWNLDRGTDGGWWITAMTGRKTTLSPLLFRPRASITESNDKRPYETCSVRFWSRVISEDIDYLYVNTNASEWRTDTMASCLGSELVYEAQSVQIYRLQAGSP